MLGFRLAVLAKDSCAFRTKTGPAIKVPSARCWTPARAACLLKRAKPAFTPRRIDPDGSIIALAGGMNNPLTVGVDIAFIGAPRIGHRPGRLLTLVFTHRAPLPGWCHPPSPDTAPRLPRRSFGRAMGALTVARIIQCPTILDQPTANVAAMRRAVGDRPAGAICIGGNAAYRGARQPTPKSRLRPTPARP